MYQMPFNIFHKPETPPQAPPVCVGAYGQEPLQPGCWQCHSRKLAFCLLTFLLSKIDGVVLLVFFLCISLAHGQHMRIIDIKRKHADNGTDR